MGAMASSMPVKADVLFSPELNEWNGTVSVQCNIKAIRPSQSTLIREDEEALLEALLQDIMEIAANDCKIHPAQTLTDDSIYPQALSGVQGTLILSRSPNLARRIAMTYGERLECSDRVKDIRGYHTLLYPARLSELKDRWNTVILADGELIPGEIPAIIKRCPKARVMAFQRNGELNEWAKRLVLTDDALRELYVAAKRLPGGTPQRLAQAANLTPAQMKAGLYILKELDLVSFVPEPFSLTLTPPVKRSLNESRLLAALKAAAGL
jgi:hypothetical protein